MTPVDREDADPVEPVEADSLPYCAAGWRQQLVMLAVSAAAVFALAVKISMSDDQAPMAMFATQDTGAAAAKPVAMEDTGSAARLVAGSPRPSFQNAVDRIRPSTLSVRATYGANAEGAPLERVGSAVVVDPGGYAVTCGHVVVGATAINVRRFQEPAQWYAARIVATDGDLALLQVATPEPLPAAVLADSTRVGVGEWVLAVGHPFQMGLTVTAGIVSRRDAALTFPGGMQQTGLLQTDAAINEGSSGGPLINAAGEVVGINTAIYAPTGVYSGASFAIPSNRVRQFVASVLGRPRAAGTGWGLGLVSLTPDIAAKLGFPGEAGVVVGSVAPNSAADQAQLVRGDVITAIAGQPVRDLASAMSVRDRLVGTAGVAVDVWRMGVVRTVTLKPPEG